jgi:hypothetical protein
LVSAETVHRLVVLCSTHRTDAAKEFGGRTGAVTVIIQDGMFRRQPCFFIVKLLRGTRRAEERLQERDGAIVIQICPRILDRLGEILAEPCEVVLGSCACRG